MSQEMIYISNYLYLITQNALKHLIESLHRLTGSLIRTVQHWKVYKERFKQIIEKLVLQTIVLNNLIFLKYLLIYLSLILVCYWHKVHWWSGATIICLSLKTRGA